MKKLLIVLGVVLFAGVVNAQNYKPFKLGMGIGYTMPSDGGGGILIDFEPAYRINDAIAVGLRFESAAMMKMVGDEEGKVSANGSYTLNGQYYLSDAKVRPYVGLGLGLYTVASVSVGVNSAEGGGGAEFGFYPRLGVDLGHFNINLDYNLIGASTGYSVDDAGNTTEVNIKNSYLGIRAGFFIFGGRK